MTSLVFEETIVKHQTWFFPFIVESCCQIINSNCLASATLLQKNKRKVNHYFPGKKCSRKIEIESIKTCCRSSRSKSKLERNEKTKRNEVKLTRFWLTFISLEIGATLSLAQGRQIKLLQFGFGVFDSVLCSIFISSNKSVLH